MSNNLHPTFNEIFDSFFAPGHRQAQAAPSGKLPPIKAPVERDEYLAFGVPLVVDFIAFPITYGRRDEWGQMMDPDYPAGCEIQAVWLAGHDVYPLLSDELVARLEDYFGPCKG